MAILLLIRAKGVQFETYISVHTCSHKFLLIFQAVRDKEVSNAGARDGDMHFKIVLKPKVMDSSRGGACFEMSGKRGYVELKEMFFKLPQSRSWLNRGSIGAL